MAGQRMIASQTQTIPGLAALERRALEPGRRGLLRWTRSGRTSYSRTMAPRAPAIDPNRHVTHLAQAHTRHQQHKRPGAQPTTAGTAF
jgi:hypothetical protein